MYTDFHFIRPYWLFALIPCVILIVLILQHKRQQGSWAKVCDQALLPYILQQQSATHNRGVLISTAIAALLAILALAGPTWQRLPVPVFRNDSGLVIALDLSRSMLANDIKPNRLMRARYKIADILAQRKDGQTALIVYAGDAFTVTPLTTDNATITGQLNALTPDIIPSSGSNTVLALKKSLRLFKQAGLQKGHILLVTDGINVINESLAFIKQSEPYQLSVLAVGTEQGAPIKLPQGDFLKDQQGHIIVPKLSLKELKQLAIAGKGILQKISDDNSDINSLLNVIDDSKSVATDKPQAGVLIEQWDDKGPWLLLLILPLVAINFRRGILVITFLFIIPLPKNSYALEWQDLWETKNQQAQKLYQQQNFSQAAETFDDPNWKASAHYKAGHYNKVLEALKNENTADSFYNQGNALAKMGQLVKAVESYAQALKLEANDKDTLYNKKLVEKELEKQQQQQQQQDKNKSPADNQEKTEGSEQSQSENNKRDDKTAENSESQSSTNSENKEKTEQHTKQIKKPQKDTDKLQQASTQSIPIDENKQADEQWLNRIPDDPAGLLRRKFEYQYKLRKSNDNKDSQAW